MKPRFALNFSHDGISLLHRAKGGWNTVGDVALDDPALTDTLNMLRDTASSLEGGGVRSKLIIPNSEILYFETPVGGGNRAQRAEQVAAALDGRTPYALDELVFDFKVNGGIAKVAAVAQETLDEAETFANEHRFNPVSFVAIPDESAFNGEPWFGVTRAAQGLLPEGETVERDRTAVKVEGRVNFADSEQTPIPPAPAEAQPQLALDPVQENSAPVAAPDTPASPATDESAAAPDAPAKPEAATKPDAASDPDVPPRPEPMTPLPPPEIRPSFSTRREASSAPKPVARMDTPSRLTLSPGSPTAARSLTQISVISDTTPEAIPAARLVAEKAKTDSAPAKVAPKADPKPAKKPKRRAGLPKPKFNVPSLPKAKLPSLPKRERKPQATPTPPARAKPKPTPAPKAAAAPEPKAAPTITALSSSAPLTLDESDALTVFGARKAQTEPGSARYLGLILTVTLVLVMAAVALWAALFMTRDVALLPEEDPVVQAPVITPTLSELENEPEVPAPATLTPETAQATYEATGIWPLAPTPVAPPAAPDDLNDVYIASIDPVIPGEDAVALPSADGLISDKVRAAEPLPPLPGQVFDLDERGLVRPTPEGTLSPDGVTVFSGRPPLAPPRRPETDAALAAPQATPENDALRAQLAQERPRRRPADLSDLIERAGGGGFSQAELAAVKPRPRPTVGSGAPTPTEPVEAEDDASGPLVIASSMRPQSRPSDFSKTVARTQEVAKTAPVVAVPAASRTAPSIPTSASVAKQATFTNGINLRDMNLVGVFGGTSDRRALVRLASGRFVKVEVGDRLDGGKVASISDDSLTYVKSGRSHTLDMPDS